MRFSYKGGIRKRSDARMDRGLRENTGGRKTSGLRRAILGKKLDKAIEKLTKQLKYNPFPVPEVDIWPTGFYRLDKLLGGGFRKGKIIEIFGSPSSCKTTFGIQMAARWVKTEDSAVLIFDTEDSYDPRYWDKLGLDKDHPQVLFSSPNTLEEVFQIMFALLETGEVGMAIIDSVHGMVPQSELDTESIPNNVALQARLMGVGVRKIVRYFSQSNAIGIFFNQLSQGIGMYSKVTSPGGRALKHYSTHRIMFVRRSPRYFDDDDGCNVKMNVYKNKLSPTQSGSVDYDLLPNQGLIYQTDIIEKAIDEGKIEVSGSWYTLDIKGKEKKFQGRQNLYDFAMDNPKLMEALYGDS